MGKPPGRAGSSRLLWQGPLFLLVGAVLGAMIWDVAKPNGGTDRPVPVPTTVSVPTTQPAFPTTQPSALPLGIPGQPDAFGRQPGDQHYGHNHP